MILAVDIGNTNIVVGCIKGEEICFVERMSTEATRTELEYAISFKNVLEMYARGFDFLPIDIYKSKASKFQIVGDKLLPPFNTIDGMGDKAAEAMEIAAKDGPYLSKDDFRQRTKVSKTLVDLMADMGLLGDLPETNQLSLFDFA